MGRTDLRPDITKEVLEEYIRKGYSQNRIAITLGTTQSTIFNKLKKYGLQVQKTKPSNYDEKALIKQLQNGWTTEQIARYFGVCTGTVGTSEYMMLIQEQMFLMVSIQEHAEITCPIFLMQDALGMFHSFFLCRSCFRKHQSFLIHVSLLSGERIIQFLSPVCDIYGF